METNEQIRQALSKALAEELESFLEQVSQMIEGELKHLEEQVVKSSQAIGRKLMEGVLNSRLHERRPVARREGRCGHVQRLVGERPKELITLVGPVSCVRAYYHCLHGGEAEAKHDCTHGEAPADALWGVDKRRTTPGVQGHISYLSARLTFEEAAETMCRTVPIGMSGRQALNLMRPVGEALAASEDRQRTACASVVQPRMDLAGCSISWQWMADSSKRSRWSCWAMARRGSGIWPPNTLQGPCRSLISPMPKNTCGTWPMRSLDAAQQREEPGPRTLARSSRRGRVKRLSPRSLRCRPFHRSQGKRAVSQSGRWTTLPPMLGACAIHSSVLKGCISAVASSRPPARPLSAHVPNVLACGFPPEGVDALLPLRTAVLNGAYDSFWEEHYAA